MTDSAHSIRFQITGYTGRDAFWRAVLPERWFARHVAKELCRSAYKGAKFSSENPLLLTLANGRTWEAWHDGKKMRVRLPARQHCLPPPVSL